MKVSPRPWVARATGREVPDGLSTIAALSAVAGSDMLQFGYSWLEKTAS